MKILITGSNGFIGKNLCSTLAAIGRSAENRQRYGFSAPFMLYKHERGMDPKLLEEWCAQVDCVVHLAGVNRTDNASDFQKGNVGFLQALLDLLKKNDNACPVIFTSSIHANPDQVYVGSEYSRTKKDCEDLLFEYATVEGVQAYVFRLPNVYGKWCRPNYNSVVATFCSNVRNGVPITVDDPSVSLNLVYVDDVVDDIIKAILGSAEIGSDGLCRVHNVEQIRLGEIVDYLGEFKGCQQRGDIPLLPKSGFKKNLYSTFLSYSDPREATFSPKESRDDRGSFAELIHADGFGQISVNVSKPGAIKGNHWHNSKIEKFCVVKGEALVQMRSVLDTGEDPDLIEYRVSGSDLEVIDMIPGYTHNIINVSEEELITIIWCNEIFDPSRPDTFFDEVAPKV